MKVCLYSQASWPSVGGIETVSELLPAPSGAPAEKGAPMHGSRGKKELELADHILVSSAYAEPYGFFLVGIGTKP